LENGSKKIKGKKRHILVDKLGLLLHAVVHPADIQDRDGGILVMATLFGLFPFLQKLFADGGYQGPQFANALAKTLAHVNLEIVKRPDRRSASNLCPNDGLSNAPLLGSIDAAAPHHHLVGLAEQNGEIFHRTKISLDGTPLALDGGLLDLQGRRGRSPRP
jgi:hypothetical protein